MKLREALGVIAGVCVTRGPRSEVTIRVADREPLERAATELDLSRVVGPIRRATASELLAESARLSAAAMTTEEASL